MATFSTRDYSYGELSSSGSSLRVYGKANVDVYTSGANYTVKVRTYCMSDLSIGTTYTSAEVQDPYAVLYPIRVPDASNAVTVNRECAADARVTIHPTTGTQILAKSSSACEYTGKRSHSQEQFKFTLNWSASKLYLKSATSGSISKTNGLNGGSGEQYVTIPPLDSYSVSYNANGGSGAPAAQTKWYGENLTLSSARPTRVGYTFTGWGLDATGESGAIYQPGSTYTSNSAVMLYAQWTQNLYTVTYNANGGTGTPSPQSKLHGQTLPLTTGIPTRSGYAFLGWSTNPNGLVQYKRGDYYSADMSVTLYAVWAELYDVTYAPNDNAEYPASGLPDSQVKQEGTDLNISTTVPSRPGFAFRGWATSATSTTIYLQPGGTYRSDADITLYAVWVAVYDIVYSANAGDSILGIPDPQVKYSDSDIVIPNVTPTRQGWLFAAWSLEPDRIFPSGNNRYLPGGTLKGDFEDVDVNRTVTLYAIWKQSAYAEIVKVDRDDSDASRLSVMVKVIGTGTLKAIGLSTTKTITVTENGTFAMEGVDTSMLTVTLDVVSSDGLRAPTVSVTVPPGNVPALSLKQDADGKLLGMGVAADAEEGYLESSLPIASNEVISSSYKVGTTNSSLPLDECYDGTKSYAYTVNSSVGFIVIRLAKTSLGSVGSFRVSVYGNYECAEWIFGGYNYDNTNCPGWYRPSATLVSATSDRKRTAYMGYTEANDLWVAIPCEAYIGLTISDTVLAWTRVMKAIPVRDRFIVERYEGALADLGTVEKTFTRTRPVRKDEVGTSSGYDVWGLESPLTPPTEVSVPVVKPDGVMEVGQYLDFHYCDPNYADVSVPNDYSLRMEATNQGQLYLSSPLQVNTGGTGARNRKDAMRSLSYLGGNITGGTGNDTGAFWSDQGSGFAWFSATGQLNGQPSQYGFLINIVDGKEVHQEFWVQNNGKHYKRGINNTGTMPGWNHIIDNNGGAFAGSVAFNAANNQFPSHGGSWISQKNQATVPITFPTPSTMDGSRYDAYMWGKNTNGDVWTFGGGPSNTVGFNGYRAATTGNYTDWSARLNITTGWLELTNGLTVPGELWNHGMLVRPGKLIYNGNTNGTAWLSESCENFTIIEIYFYSYQNITARGCCKVYSPNGRYANLIVNHYMPNVNGAHCLQAQEKTVYCNGSALYVSRNGYGNTFSNNTCGSNEQNSIYITEVIGYW